MIMSRTPSRSITDYGEEEEESVTQSWDGLFSNALASYLKLRYSVSYCHSYSIILPSSPETIFCLGLLWSGLLTQRQRRLAWMSGNVRVPGPRLKCLGVTLLSLASGISSRESHSGLGPTGGRTQRIAGLYLVQAFICQFLSPSSLATHLILASRLLLFSSFFSVPRLLALHPFPSSFRYGHDILNFSTSDSSHLSDLDCILLCTM